MLAITIFGSIFTFGLAALAMEIVGIAEGVIYLTKSDDDFYRTYRLGQQEWF